MIGALPELTRAEADLGRALSRRRSLPPVLGQEAAIVAAPDSVADATTVGVAFANGPARLLAPAAILRRILSEHDPAAAQAAPAWAALLLEQALAPELDALQAAWPALAATFSAEPPLAEACPYAVGLTFAGAAMRLELSPGAAAALAPALAALPHRRTALPQLPVSLAARLGWCSIPLRDLRNARAGDIVLPETAGHGRVFLVASETIRWPARHDPGRLTVDGARATAGAARDWWMQDEALPGAETSDLDELPVRLSFEIGQLDLTLAELETLGPGHVFELHRPEADGVDIIANGRRIGAGRAVTINGALGVQIVRLGGR